MTFLSLFFALLAVGNPADSIPLYLSLTKGRTTKELRKIQLVAFIAFLVITIVCLVAGQLILEFFTISISSFRIAGGLIIMLLGFKLLLGIKGSQKEEEDEEKKEAHRSKDLVAFAIVPVALPVLVNPGLISAIILYGSDKDVKSWEVLIAIVILAVVNFIGISLAPWISKRVGETGMLVIEKIMGLIMIAIGVEFITSGLTEVFTNWVK